MIGSWLRSEFGADIKEVWESGFVGPKFQRGGCRARERWGSGLFECVVRFEWGAYGEQAA